MVSMETLRGVIERITYQSEETGYTVARLTPETAVEKDGRRRRTPREVTVVGTLTAAAVGEWVELGGRWTMHPEYGRQFVVEHIQTALPVTVEGIEKYLGSGLIRGVGPVMARRLVERFGVNTLQVIEHAPHRLTLVSGIGPRRAEQIVAAWNEQRAIKMVMLFLQSHGVSTALAARIYQTYGDDALLRIRQEPYALARDVYGVGFVTADRIAHALGVPVESPARVAAGIAHTLSEATDAGHVYLPLDLLTQQACALLNVTPEDVQRGLRPGWAANQIVLAPEAGGEAVYLADLRAHGTQEEVEQQIEALLAANPAVYLAPLYYAEVGAGNGIKRLVQASATRLGAVFHSATDWNGLIGALEEEQGFVYAPQQRDAIRTALTHRLTVLTGGPGTGKTTTLRTVLDLCRQHERRVLLAAPTGRAAKRLAEAGGQEARTVHRLLEYRRGEPGESAFARNEANPLDADLLIVDEASMLDLLLFNHLLKALPPGMHLLLVGDVDQLPSVGAGNVLRDVIEAIEGDAPAEAGTAETPCAETPRAARGRAAVVRLRAIFRQQEGSFIITNAHRINQGALPLLDNRHALDFFLFKAETAERALALCVELVHSRIPRRFAIPPRDIQVLSPMHRGPAGVIALNEAIQAAINPPADGKPERRAGGRALRVGDRVMQLRNNYDKEVFNGDIGTLTAIDLELQQITVAFEGRAVLYEGYEADELTHAFAVSVHKSQGSEYPAVVLPVLTSHTIMLQRNLLYTAVTRARRLVVLVGQERAVALAVRSGRVAERYSGLCARLRRTLFGAK